MAPTLEADEPIDMDEPLKAAPKLVAPEPGKTTARMSVNP